MPLARARPLLSIDPIAPLAIGISPGPAHALPSDTSFLADDGGRRAARL